MIAFTPQTDSTHAVVYGAPDGGTMHTSYWSSDEAALDESATLTTMGSPYVRVVAL